ncbi:MAG: ribosome assembly RNA-binding protein YhbY [Tissierellia bacterium]|nr:ribosome assembly RNA-binding protein YhbY [Tissierellia bacterium]
MITSKQRSYLKSLANKLNPSVQVGKVGLTDAIIDELEIQLEHKELVKISVLENSPVEVEEIRDEILERTKANFVQSIGNKLIIYRESKDHKQIEL